MTGQTARGDERAAEAARLAHEQRLKLNRSVRETRDALTSTSGIKPAYDYELLRLYAEHRLASSFALFLLVSLVGLASSLWTGGYSALIWTFLALTIHALNLAACRRFMAAPMNMETQRHFRIIFILLDFLFGISWVLNINVLVDVGAQGAGDFSLFAMLLVVAVFSMLAASVPPAVYASTMPVAGMVVMQYLFRGKPQDLVLAGLTAGAEAYFVMVANRLHLSAISALEARSQLDDLIGEMEQAKAKSDEVARRAEAANLAKSRFLAQMSHELRTPLNAILGFSEVMKNQLLGAHAVPVYGEYASDIHDSGQHLLNLINEILDLSRIEAGRYELREEPIDLELIAADSHRLLKLHAGSRRISVLEEFRAEVPRISADMRAVRQICFNLLSNALKFTPEQGVVILRTGLTLQNEPFLSVADSGPGIPREEIPQVLSSFGQGSLALEMSASGTGLGLPIVKGLAELHGGRFELQSEIGQGTEARVVFPASRILMPGNVVRDPRHPAGFWRERQTRYLGAA
jgi:two-component system cell cycle sensor histidine kinase PleC